jgi:DNA-binding transcriptional LysR family regulator
VEPLVVAFVPGVTPGKWERIWRERRLGTLTLVPIPQAGALEGLADGSVHMAFLRDVLASEDRHAIQLYREHPVVVAPRDSLVAALDTVDAADLTALDVHPVDLLVDDGASAVELVAANVGVTVLPQSVARLHSRKDVVARPVTGVPDTGIALVWPVERPHPFTDTFIGVVRGRTANSSR